MKTLTAFGESHQAEKITKNMDSITGYIGSKKVFSFNGIRDFSFFVLSSGEEWDIDNDAVKDLQRRQDESENAILSLIEMSFTGGM